MKKITLLLAAALLGVILVGCGSTPSKYRDAETLNPGRLSPRDWEEVVVAAGNAMLADQNFNLFLEDYKTDALKKLTKREASGEELTSLEKRTSTMPLLWLTTIQNNTGEHIDTRNMTNRLREIIVNANKVRFTTAAAGGGQDIDEGTEDVRELRKNPNFNKNTVAERGKVNAPDLSLSGSITKQIARSGRENELSYLFTLTLTDNVTGMGVFTYTKTITRGHTGKAIGW